MRERIKELNKRSLADATGISYGRLRKFASRQLNSLTKEEVVLIHNYLLKMADDFIVEENDEGTKL